MLVTVKSPAKSVHRLNTKSAIAYSWLASLAAVLLLCSTGEAQLRTVRTSPRAPSAAAYAPRFSSYLGLLRVDGGPLPNYYQFVRPRTELQDTLAQQNRAIQQERQRILTVGRQLDTIQQQGGVRPTGVTGGFMRYSHFYPTLR